MKKLFPILVLVVLTALFWTGSAAAQDSVPSDDQVNAIAKQLFCPVCENTPLDVCPTEACKQWRALIRLKLSEGWTEDQIKQYFVEQYGARVLAEPPRQGWYWLIYIVPVVLLGIGIYILYRAYLSMRAPLAVETESVETATQAAVSQDDYLRRVEAELKKRN
jgi:cytochrome c-type biogenesis protein CcmH